MTSALTTDNHGEMNLGKWIDAINAWTLFMQAQGLSALTIELRRYQLSRLAEDRLHRSPWRVSNDELTEWLATQEWSAQTRKSYRSGIRMFYGWAKRNGRTKNNPAEDLPPVRVPRGVPHPTPSEHIEQVLVSANDRDRLILMLAGFAGLRRAEIASLPWPAVTLDRIRVTGKGGHVRHVPIHARLGTELIAEQARRNTGTFGSGYRYGSPNSVYVFPGRTPGTHIMPKSLGRIASRVLGPDWTAHSLRHSFGTNALSHSHDLAGVQDLLGHASPATTRIYTKVADDTLRKIVDAL